MEGTRHERVALVVISYIIGFLTALIAFGIEVTAPNTATIIKATPAHEIAANRMVDAVDLAVTVRQDETGLHVTRDGKERILTANKASLISAFGEDVTGNGYHVTVVGEEVSPSEDFVYFCEQLDENDRDCDPFIYSFATDTAHRVQIDGEVTTLPIENHSVSWSPGGRLQAQGAVSVDLNQPWMLE